MRCLHLSQTTSFSPLKRMAPTFKSARKGSSQSGHSKLNDACFIFSSGIAAKADRAKSYNFLNSITHTHGFESHEYPRFALSASQPAAHAWRKSAHSDEQKPLSKSCVGHFSSSARM